jgi:hypothetical protein
MKISKPNIAGLVVAGAYAILVFLAWLPMLLPPADALEGLGALILTLPTSMFLGKAVDAVSIATTSYSASGNVHTAVLLFSAALNAAVLYFAAWGIVRFMTEKRNPNQPSQPIAGKPGSG